MSFKVDLDNVLKRLKVHEGIRHTVYDDSLGIPTIGMGFAIKDLYLDDDDIERIASKKLAKLLPSIANKWPFLKDSPEVVREVVIDMCWQMGVTGVSKFRKFLQALEEKDYGWAAIEMLDSKWSKQTPQRAQYLSDLIKKLAQ